MLELTKALNDPLDKAIERSGKVKELECINLFIEVVVMNAVVHDSNLVDGGKFDANGSKQAWVQLLRLNKSMEFSLQQLRAKNIAEIDNNSVRHCAFDGGSTAESPDQRLWEIVGNLAKWKVFPGIIVSSSSSK